MPPTQVRIDIKWKGVQIVEVGKETTNNFFSEPYQ